MTSYTHSGTTGDVFSSLAIVRCLGAGDYYLRLNNLDNICNSIGWGNAGRHSGRMRQSDFDFLAPLMEQQSCITKFAVWQGEAVEHELEKRAVNLNCDAWPRNFANQDAVAMSVDREAHFETLQIRPYVEVDTPTVVPNRPVCISRNPYYLEGIQDITQVDEWRTWIDNRLMDQAFFVGLPEDHAWFEDTMKVKVDYRPTSDALELARLIAGAKMMIGNQSMPATLAVGIGTSLWIETRKNTPLDNNEILYPYRTNINYF
jgi:hypothetical protein